MFSRDLLRSTYFRFAMVLAGLFVLANLGAGWIAFQAIHDDLDRRVEQAAVLMSVELADTFERDGRDALVEATRARATALDPEDDIVWLGLADGTFLAGHRLPDPQDLAVGDVSGTRLGQDDDDTSLLTSRQIGDLRLITARSYEDTDDIARTVLKSFGAATLIVTLLSALVAFILSRRGQLRIEAISSVLSKVAAGEMQQRIETHGHSDDLGRLSERINDALEQLEATVLGIKQVSADIAHDLRTPINRLGIQVESLTLEASNQPALQDKLNQASSNIRQITNTFDALLRISQIEAGARKAKFRAVPIAGIAAALYEAYAAVCDDAGQTLLVSSNMDANTLVHGDQDLLTQLGANLIENAIRHAGQGATIRLETGSGLNGVWLSVSDDGPGIPPEEYERVTERFYRLDKARHTPGSGLGLALVKAIADLHKAGLRLSDAKPGLAVRVGFKPFSEALKSRD